MRRQAAPWPTSALKIAWRIKPRQYESDAQLKELLDLFKAHRAVVDEIALFVGDADTWHAYEPLEIFGDGSQLRDPLYVDDAVEAFLVAGAAHELPSRAYNVGGPEPLSLAAIAESLSVAAKLPAPARREFPEERKPSFATCHRSPRPKR